MNDTSLLPTGFEWLQHAPVHGWRLDSAIFDSLLLHVFLLSARHEVQVHRILPVVVAVLMLRQVYLSCDDRLAPRFLDVIPTLILPMVGQQPRVLFFDGVLSDQGGAKQGLVVLGIQNNDLASS